MSCSDGPRRHTADEAAGSAIYECGYNSCGCNLKLSEVWSGLCGADVSLDLSSAQGLPPTTAQENAVAFDSRARCRGTVARHINLFAWENRR